MKHYYIIQSKALAVILRWMEYNFNNTHGVAPLIVASSTTTKVKGRFCAEEKRRDKLFGEKSGRGELLQD